jgi:RhtB (resistance to homoserine/threonine) family protein
MLAAMWGSVLAFALVAALLTVTPGIDTALVIRTTLAAGRATGLRTAAGICTGVVTWGMLSAVGVSAVLTASRVAYDVLRLLGAAYLVVLGVRTLLAARRGRAPVAGDEAGAELPGVAGSRAAFRTGLLTNLLNPKVGVFYVTLLPQFIPAGTPVLGMSVLLAGIHAVEGIAWLSLLVLVVHRLGMAMRRPSVRRALERVTGVVLVGFGVRVALERV